MLIHRVKVQECASAAITEFEYKHCLNRIREYVGPLSESASYQMLCSSSKPPAMIQKQETFERKMRRNLFGLYEISVWINEKRFNFIIDSGAQISGIRRRCLEQLHLQTIQGKLEIGSVGAKKMMLEAVMASSVDIGGISWQHVPLVILEQQQFSMPFFHHDLLRFDGILGWDLLSQIDFRGELEGWVEQVVAGGESGKEVRVCDYEWVLDIRQQCIDANVGFWFKQTGSYLLKDGHEYKVARQFQHSQARKAELNYTPDK